MTPFIFRPLIQIRENSQKNTSEGEKRGRKTSAGATEDRYVIDVVKKSLLWSVQTCITSLNPCADQFFPLRYTSTWFTHTNANKILSLPPWAFLLTADAFRGKKEKGGGTKDFCPKRVSKPPHPYWLNKFATNHFTNAQWGAIEVGGNTPFMLPLPRRAEASTLGSFKRADSLWSSGHLQGGLASAEGSLCF